MESAPAIPASGNSNLPPSVPGSPSAPSPTHATNNAESSTAGAALQRQTTPRVRNRSGATYAYRTTPSHEQLVPVDLISPPESPTAVGPAITAASMLGEAPPDVGRTASALPSRGSSEPHNGDGGIVLRCPQPGKQKSGRKRRRDEQKRLGALSAAAAAETPSTLAGTVLATTAVVKNEDTHKDLVPVREDSPPESVVDAASGSHEDAKELNEDDPDLNIQAGLIVNGVSL